MRRNQMFPQRFLSAADVQAYNPVGAVVTVQGVIEEVFGEKGKEEVVFFLKFVELKKPYRLNKTNADALFAEVDDTDNWIGKRLRITPFNTTVTDKDAKGRAIRKEVVSASLQFVADSVPVVLPPNTDLTEYAYEVDNNLRKPLPGAAPRALPPIPPPPALASTEPIGPLAAAAFLKHIRAVGKVFDDFLRYAHAKDQAIYAQAYGKEISEIPSSVRPMMREFLASLGVKTGADVPPPPPPPPPAPAPAATGDVFDPTTGEVIKRGAADPYADIDVPF